MMRAPIVLLALAFGLVGICAPVFAAAVPCADDGGAENCGLDCEWCFLCLCCSHAPQSLLNAIGVEQTANTSGSIGLWESHKLRPPLPRDILHIPILTLSR